MKTIFDKIDTKYLEHAAHGAECATGTCEHVGHSGNGILWLVVVALTIITIKYCHASKNRNQV